MKKIRLNMRKGATTVGQPTPDDTLHDLQKSKGEPGGAYGPRTGPYDKQPWQGNRDGFDAKQPPRQRTKRKFIPHMDTPDDEGGGFMGGRTMGNVGKRRSIFADARLTPTGEAKLEELRGFADPQAADLYIVLDRVAQNRFVTNEEVFLDKAGDIEDVWHMALKEGLIISEDLPEDEEFLGELPGGLPEGIASLKKEKKADFNPAAPVVETPEERAAVIEQPAIKPINRDMKRDRKPKKRWDFNESLTVNPSYKGEDSSGWGKERILLSMKKTRLSMKKTSVDPKYTNALTATYFDTLTSDPSQPDIEDAARATGAALNTLLANYPEINEERLAIVAEEADRLMGPYPSSFTEIAQQYQV